MSNRRRDLLHRKHVHAFKLWAIDHGYAAEDPKGAFEVLRLRAGSGGPPISFYERAGNACGPKVGGSDHITTTGKGTEMVRDFLRDRRALSSEGPSN